MFQKVLENIKDFWDYLLVRRHQRLRGMVVEYHNHGVEHTEDSDFGLLSQEIVHDVMNRKKIVVFTVGDKKLYAFRKGKGVEIEKWDGQLPVAGYGYKRNC